MKFISFKNKKHHHFLKEKLCQYYGRNYAITYKADYKFDEEWEGVSFNEEELNYKFLNNYHFFQNFLFFTVMIAYTLIIWLSTFQTFFIDQIETFTSPLLFIFPMILQICLLVFEINIGKIKMEQVKNPNYFLRTSYRSIIIVLYLFLKILSVDKLVNIKIFFAFEAIGIFLMYKRASNIYNSFKLTNVVLVYQYQFKIIDIILNLVIIAHFIAIILYLSTNLGFDKTWVSEGGIQHESPLVKYIYSFYFCCTTILTVGYGDISPKNYGEIIIITIVQIFGIIAFGSFINEIGYSLQAIRKTRQNINRDLHIIQKIKKWYRLDDDLAKRARSHIINSKAIDSKLTPQQQQSFMVKLSEGLRQQIQFQNKFKIAKSSVFLLLRWSKCFQTAVSSRLVNIIFPPGQFIYQPFGRQRIYIIKDGKIQIYASKRGAKRGKEKALKIIQNKISNEVSNNTYGYTSVISQRPVRLYAIAKQNTSGYYIDKQQFLECINQRQTDFEYFHEFKDKIDHSIFSESIQVPQLENSKHHYNPTRTHIFRLHKNQKTYQNRLSCLRSNKKLSVNVHSRQQNSFLKQKLINRTISKEIVIQKSKKNNSQNKCWETNAFFQSLKEYQNYFPRNNYSKIVYKQQIELKIFKNENIDTGTSIVQKLLQNSSEKIR